MNQQTKAFLTQFAALCDAHGMTFRVGQSHRAEEGQTVFSLKLVRADATMPTSDRFVLDAVDLDDLKAQLAQD